MLGNIGSQEITFLVILGVLLFGSKRVTQIARNLGQAKKELDKAKEEYQNALNGRSDSDKSE